MRRGAVRLPLRQLGRAHHTAARAKSTASFAPTPWTAIAAATAAIVRRCREVERGGVVAVLSPFLTLEEAFLFATYFKGLSKDVRLALGPVPVVGEDDTYPKDVPWQPVEPVKFTIRAEKCPNRRGVEAVLKHFQGSVVSVRRRGEAAGRRACGSPAAIPDREQLAQHACRASWKAPACCVVQDLFHDRLTAAAKYVLPATTAFEKDGTFVNHAGWPRRSPRGPAAGRSRTELQLAFDLLGRRGLVQAATIRAELARGSAGVRETRRRGCARQMGMRFEAGHCVMLFRRHCHGGRVRVPSWRWQSGTLTTDELQRPGTVHAVV